MLINDYGSPVGGAELLLGRLAEGLQSRGHKTCIIAGRTAGHSGKNSADHSTLTAGPPWQVILESMNPFALGVVYHALKRFKPDLVHLFMFRWQLSPLILALLKEVPTVYYMVNYKSTCPLGSNFLPNGHECRYSAGWVCYSLNCISRRAWPFMMLEQRLWHHWQHHIDFLVANSEEQRHILEDKGIRVDNVIPGGAPLRDLKPSYSEKPLLVFAGRLVREKGLFVLIHSFARVIEAVPTARLVIAGNGPLEKSIKTFVHELGLKPSVEMIGSISYAEMQQRFASAWVQAIPSLWPEPFGLVAIDAMMRGTVVAGSDCGGLRHTVVPGKTGLLLPPGDIEQWAAALTDLLSDRSKVQKMGHYGQKHARLYFNQDRFVDAFENIYDSLIRNRSENG